MNDQSEFYLHLIDSFIFPFVATIKENKCIVTYTHIKEAFLEKDDSISILSCPSKFVVDSNTVDIRAKLEEIDQVYKQKINNTKIDMDSFTVEKMLQTLLKLIDTPYIDIDKSCKNNISVLIQLLSKYPERETVIRKSIPHYIETLLNKVRVPQARRYDDTVNTADISVALWDTIGSCKKYQDVRKVLEDVMPLMHTNSIFTSTMRRTCSVSNLMSSWDKDAKSFIR